MLFMIRPFFPPLPIYDNIVAFNIVTFLFSIISVYR